MGAPRRATLPQILNGAELTFAARGFAGTRLEDIARACAIPKANILYYFGSKEELYHATLSRLLARWLADADEWLVAERDPREAMEQYIRLKMASSESRPAASRLFMQELLSGGHAVRAFLEGDLRAHVSRRADVFRCWQEKGVMTAINPVHFMFLLWSMTQAYSDMQVQLEAVLGREALTSSDFETGVATIMTFVSSVFPPITRKARARPERRGRLASGNLLSTTGKI
ncbi:TetR family transcriptional regulator [Gluconacetobacter sacchari DSM 12717]|uniref:TetR family transcriptional regulator n=2 Tax=Gluconacetobacter sacchari TaxID=92759 RepID=A0A7W4IAP5_9PROT|nr:TetR family transcriptional regulator C-terminal domain-containing protein [Gluconacetobacter sacchari]MBB2159396.1 TetR family transcriptional regulator [Gluconacetobacter sacchari]GBQ20031.1 TetR family transcriptional regulator [Gluconacetobacter sacchari DSM 12717]